MLKSKIAETPDKLKRFMAEFCFENLINVIAINKT